MNKWWLHVAIGSYGAITAPVALVPLLGLAVIAVSALFEPVAPGAANTSRSIGETLYGANLRVLLVFAVVANTGALSMAVIKGGGE